MTSKTAKWMFSLFLIFPSLASAGNIQKTLKGDGISFVVRAGEVENLVYHLDCLAGQEGEGCDSVRSLWRKKLDFNDSDTAALQVWRQIHDRYDASATLQQVDEINTRFPTRNEGIDLGKKVQIASFVANDLDDYRRNLSMVMSPSDAGQSYDLATRFYSRFKKVWNGSLEDHGKKFLERFSILFEEKALPSFFAEVSHFYEAELPKGSEFYFHLLVIPDEKSVHTHAEQIENHSVIEILANENPAERTDVIAHEAFHFFYRSASLAKHAAFINSFSSASQNYSIGAYNLINESLATAFGNGLVAEKLLPAEHFQKMLGKERSFYSDDAIDRIAKASMPFLRNYLTDKKTIYSSKFLQDYIKAFESAMGDKRDSPRLMLKNMQLVFGKSLKDAARTLVSKIKTNSVWDRSLGEDDGPKRFLQYPDMSGAVFLSVKDLPVLRGWRGLISEPQIQKMKLALKSHQSFVYGVRRNPKAYLFFFVGQNSEGVQSDIQHFVDLSHPFSGLMKRPTR